MPDSPLRVGLIGLGTVSRFYRAALDRMPSMRLAAVCDRDPEALAPLHGRVRCYLDHRDLLGAGGLDAVVVAAPNHMHAPLCRDVLAAGLPVCVEKPLATLPADGMALRVEAELRGVPLFTAFHRRYNRPVRALIDRLAAGVPPIEVRVRYLERIEEHIGRDAWYLDPDSCGGGCVADNGPNAFDVVRLLIGEVAVTDAHVIRDSAGVDRKALIELRAERASGGAGGAGGAATAAVELDWSFDGERKDVWVRLADGRTDSADMLGGFAGFKGSLWHEYVGVLADFEHRVRVGGSPHADEGGPAALTLVDAAYRAERNTRRPDGQPTPPDAAHNAGTGGGSR